MKIVSAQLNVNGKETFFAFRDDEPGDRGAIQQIFVNMDYDVSHYEQGKRLRKLASQKQQKLLIIDAGANIGASTVFFSKTWENSLVFAIEPEETNFHILCLNTKDLDVRRYHGAISNQKGRMTLSDPNRSTMGFVTSKFDDQIEGTFLNHIESLSPKDILAEMAHEDVYPFIFKIDIEGAESFLFDNDSPWVNKFPLIIIELHDWMLPFKGTSRNALREITKYDFDVILRGENLLCFNGEILRTL